MRRRSHFGKQRRTRQSSRLMCGNARSTGSSLCAPASPKDFSPVRSLSHPKLTGWASEPYDTNIGRQTDLSFPCFRPRSGSYYRNVDSQTANRILNTAPSILAGLTRISRTVRASYVCGGEETSLTRGTTGSRTTRPATSVGTRLPWCGM